MGTNHSAEPSVPTPTEKAAAALTRAIADDLYATSTTGNVYDVTVKYNFESWRECAERIGGIAAESTPAAVRVLLAGDWLERVLEEHSGWHGDEDGIHCDDCDERIADWDAYGPRALRVHQAAAIRAAVGVGL